MKAKPPEWFEDEEFWRVSFEQMFPAWRWEQAPTEAAQIASLARLAEGRVLDLCCGPGRHSCALAQAGFEVTGVDRTPYLLEFARRQAAERGLAIDFVEADMRTFDVGQGFDLAVNLFTSFGYIEDYEENTRVLSRIHACLRPGGRLVIDVRSKDGLGATPPPARFSKTEDGYFAQLGALEDDATRLRTTWFYLHDGRYQKYELVHYLYSGEELLRLLNTAGYRAVELFADFEGSAYTPTSQRLVAVATR